MWKYYNPNPLEKNTGDCAVRALSKALDVPWYVAKIYLDVCSMELAEVETSDLVWGRILDIHGFEIETLYCQDGCTLEGFCQRNPKGTFVVKLPNHVVCVIDGCYFDSWDSGNENPIYCWRKNENK